MTRAREDREASSEAARRRKGTRGAADAGAVTDALAAVDRHDWDSLKLLLHPYVRWTTQRGETLRGRNRAMAGLIEAGSLAPPSEWELRDEQIYRWTEGSA